MAIDDRILTSGSKANAAQRGRAAVRGDEQRVGLRASTVSTAADTGSKGECVTVADLMAQLVAEAEAARQRPDEFGASEFAEKANMPFNSATRFLNERIKAGQLKKRKGLINGKSGWLYSAVNKD